MSVPPMPAAITPTTVLILSRWLAYLQQTTRTAFDMGGLDEVVVGVGGWVGGAWVGGMAAVT